MGFFNSIRTNEISSKIRRKFNTKFNKKALIKEKQNLLLYEKLAKVLQNKPTPESTVKSAKMLKIVALSTGLNTLCKQLTESGTLLTNMKIKDIIKVIHFLQNRDFIKRNYLKNTSQKGGFLNFLGPLIKTGLPFLNNVLTSLAKSVLVPLVLTAAASATNPTIQEKKFWSGTTALIIFDEEMNDTMKIIKSPEESSLLIKGVGKTIKNEAKKNNNKKVDLLA